MLLPLDKEHEKVFPDVPVVGFCNGKSLKYYLVRAALPKTNETGRCEPCGKKTCLVCNSRTTTTFTTEACGEVFKIQSGPLNCNTEKVPYLLKCKVSTMEPLAVIIKNSFKISCLAKCKRYHAYKICEHCLAVAEKESILINLLACHKKRNTSKYKQMQISDIAEVGKDRRGKKATKLHRSVMGKVTVIGNHSGVT